MKKILLPLVAMLVSMVACQKDNEGILNLEVEQYTSDAKIHLDDDNYAVWDNNDAVWVNGRSYPVIVNNTTHTASLSGVETNTTDGYKAVYPASWVTSATASSGNIGIKYPAEQIYRKNSNGEQVIDAPMAAYSDGGTLKFHNLGSILAVTVTNNNSETMIVNKIEVSTASGVINGTFNIWDITTTPRLQITMGGGSGNTTLGHIYESIAAGSTKTFYIAMPTITAQLTIKVYDQSYTYTKTQGTAHTMVASNGYTAPISSTDSPVQYAPLSNQIWYKTNNSSAISAFDNIGTLVSNTYNSTLGYYVATYSSNITSLPSYCLQYKGSLTEILIPEGVTSIGTDAFYQCSSLSNVVLPYSLTGIADAFWYCNSLHTLEIPNPNTKIEKNIFYESGLQNLILHSNNVFPNDDINEWTRRFATNFQRYYTRSDNDIDEAWDEMYRNDLWSLNTESSTPINVYVPDVDECTSISYDCGVISCLGSTNYFYKPWQRLVEMNKIQLLPLSSL